MPTEPAPDAGPRSQGTRCKADSRPLQRPVASRAVLATILDAVAVGDYPPADGSLHLLPQPSDRDAGVISFTAHTVVFADTDRAWVAAQLPPGDLSAPLSAGFLAALGHRLGRRSHSVDMLTCAPPIAGPPPAGVPPLTELAGPAGTGQLHPRVARALRYRDEVRAWQAPGGVLILGRGVAGRWETAIEVDPARRGQGLGTQLATLARYLVPAGSPLWAQIAPANAASVRAFLAAGFRPVGAEALLSQEQPG